MGRMNDIWCNPSIPDEDAKEFSDAEFSLDCEYNEIAPREPLIVTCEAVDMEVYDDPSGMSSYENPRYNDIRDMKYQYRDGKIYVDRFTYESDLYGGWENSREFNEFEEDFIDEVCEKSYRIIRTSQEKSYK